MKKLFTTAFALTISLLVSPVGAVNFTPDEYSSDPQITQQFGQSCTVLTVADATSKVFTNRTLSQDGRHFIYMYNSGTDEYLGTDSNYVIKYTTGSIEKYRLSGGILNYLSKNTQGEYYIYKEGVQTLETYGDDGRCGYRIYASRTGYDSYCAGGFLPPLSDILSSGAYSVYIQEIGQYTGITKFKNFNDDNFAYVGQKRSCSTLECTIFYGINLNGNRSSLFSSYNTPYEAYKYYDIGFGGPNNTFYGLVKKNNIVYHFSCPVPPVFKDSCLDAIDYTYCSTSGVTKEFSSSCGISQTPTDFAYEGICKSELSNAISRMYTNGLTRYSNQNDYRPRDGITREQAAKFYGQFAKMFFGRVTDTTKSCVFKDLNQVDPTLLSNVIEACQLGIFQGAKGYFMPKQQLTNGQALAVLMRIVSRREDETGPIRYENYRQESINLRLSNDLILGTLANGNKAATRGEVGITLYRSNQLGGVLCGSGCGAPAN